MVGGALDRDADARKGVQFERKIGVSGVTH